MHPADIFAAIAAYNSLRMPLISIPMNLAQFGSLSVTAERISSYLLMEEHKPRTKAGDDAEVSDLIIDVKDADFVWGTSSAAATSTANSNSSLNGVCAKENESRFKLRAINLSVHRVQNHTTNGNHEHVGHPSSNGNEDGNVKAMGKGTLVAVVGSVGSGKTSLLCSLVGVGTTITRGTAWCVDSLGYVPQAPFVLSGTVLDNILMGRALDEQRLQHATAAAAFDADLRLMPRRLQTEIGERGVTLSGGQKQRLAIARAIYAVSKGLLRLLQSGALWKGLDSLSIVPSFFFFTIHRNLLF